MPWRRQARAGGSPAESQSGQRVPSSRASQTAGAARGTSADASRRVTNVASPIACLSHRQHRMDRIHQAPVVPVFHAPKYMAAAPFTWKLAPDGTTRHGPKLQGMAVGCVRALKACGQSHKRRRDTPIGKRGADEGTPRAGGARGRP